MNESPHPEMRPESAAVATRTHHESATRGAIGPTRVALRLMASVVNDKLKSRYPDSPIPPYRFPQNVTRTVRRQAISARLAPSPPTEAHRAPSSARPVG